MTSHRNWRLDRRVHRQELLGAAVANNALWCDAVCRSHGCPGVFSDRLWVNADHGLDFYPNAITLCPDVTAAEIAPVRVRRPGFGGGYDALASGIIVV